ncbi:class I tRNA ligase family protein [Streptomyces malaysiensis]|uniref:Class I tRNA ligase family protein n=1 Tax=Streptomyces malaysiensis subsp. samsunensis TaxID=459658 RepID=A0A9X2RUE1_STRMQ|nr:class I tRNA ligase family protein [Streptomyces samsunensis]MCQ8828674.1 class I tRNA ligase family protein [Streptomyces samsunensis]
MLPLWNAWHFLTLYAGDTEGRVRTDADHPLDRYLLAKTRDLVALTTRAMDGYDLSRACSALRDHLDVLTNWYIRCSLDRVGADVLPFPLSGGALCRVEHPDRERRAEALELRLRAGEMVYVPAHHSCTLSEARTPCRLLLLVLHATP